MISCRSSVSIILIFSLFLNLGFQTQVAFGAEDEAPSLNQQELRSLNYRNVLEEGKVYLALSSLERGYALKLESSDYRKSLKDLVNSRALALCQEAGFESLAAAPKTMKVQPDFSLVQVPADVESGFVPAPENGVDQDVAAMPLQMKQDKVANPLEAWILKVETQEDGTETKQLVLESFPSYYPWILTNDGCKRMTTRRSLLLSAAGFGIGTLVSAATIPFTGPIGVAGLLGNFGAFCGFLGPALLVKDHKMGMPIRRKKALEREEKAKKVHYLHFDFMSKSSLVRHSVFTEVLCQ